MTLTIKLFLHGLVIDQPISLTCIRHNIDLADIISAFLYLVSFICMLTNTIKKKSITTTMTTNNNNNHWNNVKKISNKPAHVNLHNHLIRSFVIFMSLLNIHIHSCRISLVLFSLPLTACSLSPWHHWVSAAIVTSMSNPTSSLSLSAPVCPPAVWHAAAPALSNALQRQQD